MSRLYDFKIEISGLTTDEFSPLTEILGNIGFSGDIDLASMQDKKATYEGQTSLGGGQSEEEAHEEIKTALKAVCPNVKVTTYWHYAEWHDWDNIFGQEE
jgi:hypothetical protein